MHTMYICKSKQNLYANAENGIKLISFSSFTYIYEYIWTYMQENILAM